MTAGPCYRCGSLHDTRLVALRWNASGDVGAPFACCPWCERDLMTKFEHGRLVAPDGTALKPR